MTDPALLILDVDESLVFATEAPVRAGHDFDCGGYTVYCRPFLDEFLQRVRAHFRLAVWSSASADYVDCIVEKSPLRDVALEFVWTRDRCVRVYDMELHEHFWVKDLKKVRRRGYSLARVLMIDDTPAKLVRNYGNLVRVREYQGDSADNELGLLGDYLLRNKDEADFRRVEKRGWRASV
jgi:RNA polymerase II subunit A small phosphatase-like protein